MIKLKDSSILMFIPRFLRNDKKIKNLITAIDTVLKEVLERFSSMKRMQKISEGELTDEEIELLLWEKHVDYFDKTLTKEQKIKLIQNAERAHLKKGTRSVLETHLKIIFGELQLQEWHEAGLEPFHFQILSNFRISDEVLVRINRTVEEYRTTRSVFEGVKVNEVIPISYNVAVGIYDIKEELFTVMIIPEQVASNYGIGIYDTRKDTL